MGYQIRKFRIWRIKNLNRIAVIAKALFLAETFYRYEVRMFRDHECRLAEYPGGYLCEGARSFAPLTKAPSGTPVP